MYAVIRAGGKQYRVAPGDVIKVEKLAPASDGNIEFNDILAVANDGKIGGPQGETRVVGQVVEEGRNKKILVFHYKRKKQYKKLQGHRQPFTAVRITEITFDGQKFSAPEAPKKKSAKPKAEAAPASETAPAKKAATKKAPAKKATARTAKPKAKKK
jgi:large subunit ribosomal protein L21